MPFTKKQIRLLSPFLWHYRPSPWRTSLSWLATVAVIVGAVAPQLARFSDPEPRVVVPAHNERVDDIFFQKGTLPGWRDKHQKIIFSSLSVPLPTREE